MYDKQYIWNRNDDFNINIFFDIPNIDIGCVHNTNSQPNVCYSYENWGQNILRKNNKFNKHGCIINFDLLETNFVLFLVIISIQWYIVICLIF